ncbi:hypothetical protein ACLOJK_027510 [Asimina triloba]
MDGDPLAVIPAKIQRSNPRRRPATSTASEPRPNQHPVRSTSLIWPFDDRNSKSTLTISSPAASAPDQGVRHLPWPAPAQAFPQRPIRQITTSNRQQTDSKSGQNPSSYRPVHRHLHPKPAGTHLKAGRDPPMASTDRQQQFREQ